MLSSPTPTDLELAAFSATASSFRGWCHPQDVDAALVAASYRIS